MVDYGYQERDFRVPTYSRLHPDANIEDLRHDRFEYDYNPWGTGSEAQVQRRQFEEMLTSNEQQLVNTYNRLAQKAYGYSYYQLAGETRSAVPASSYTGAYSHYNQTGMTAREAFERGITSNTIAITQDVGRGETFTTYAQRGQTAHGAPGADPAGTQINVLGQKLTDIQEYQLYRIEHMLASQEDLRLGSGDIGDYDYASALGISGQFKGQGQEGYTGLDPARERIISRQQRAGGKLYQGFKSELSRPDDVDDIGVVTTGESGRIDLTGVSQSPESGGISAAQLVRNQGPGTGKAGYRRGFRTEISAESGAQI